VYEKLTLEACPSIVDTSSIQQLVMLRRNWVQHIVVKETAMKLILFISLVLLSYACVNSYRLVHEIHNAQCEVKWIDSIRM
jgi:hypothetical protein